MKLNWNFPGGEGVQNYNLPLGEYGYFLELHITKFLWPPISCTDDLLF